MLFTAFWTVLSKPEVTSCVYKSNGKDLDRHYHPEYIYYHRHTMATSNMVEYDESFGSKVLSKGWYGGWDQPPERCCIRTTQGPSCRYLIRIKARLEVGIIISTLVGVESRRTTGHFLFYAGHNICSEFMFRAISISPGVIKMLTSFRSPQTEISRLWTIQVTRCIYMCDDPILPEP